jgi:kynurenine formamidase
MANGVNCDHSGCRVRTTSPLKTLEETVVHTVARRGALAALAATPLAFWLAPNSAQAARSQAARAQAGSKIPRGYAGVDPRTATRVPLWQELSPTNPIFEGDPEFTFEIFTTIPESGYLLEHITSLGTHTGTHISAPAHFVEGAKYLSELTESWTLMPLAVIDVRERIEEDSGDFSLGVNDLKRWEKKHGRIPANGCVLLLTGFAEIFGTAVAKAALKKAAAEKAAAAGGFSVAHHAPGSYFDPAPGFTGEAAAWLFDHRSIGALGSDTFGPDATSDEDFSATLTTLEKGGITVENVGPGLASMRAHGDWVSINGGRPKFSGFQMGITGFTR